jgi:outer membrane lipoprotein SlyB
MYNLPLNRVSFCIVGAALTLLAGCELTSHRVGQTASVQFGVVQSAQQVTLDSNAAQGAIIGGTIGVLASGSGSRGRGAATGAVVGGAATAASQGNRKGIQYTVQMLDGSSLRIVSDQREIKANDCVAIERVGNSANIRRASSDYCDPGNAQAVGAVSEANKSEAVHCQTAKQELATASDEKAVDLAMRKVELLCDD